MIFRISTGWGGFFATTPFAAPVFGTKNTDLANTRVGTGVARVILAIAIAATAIFGGLGCAVAQSLTKWTLEGPLFPGADSSPVLLPNGQIRLYFAPGSLALNEKYGGIISAVSSNGRSFVRDPGVRIPFSDGNPAEVRVVPLKNGHWRMFFSTSRGGHNGGIGSAISDDGLNFTVESGLRIAADVTGRPSEEPDGNAVVTLPNGTFRIYFGLNLAGGKIGQTGIYSAASTDMLKWTLDQGVRVGAGSRLGGSARHPFAIANDNGSITLFYWDDLIPTHTVNNPYTTGIKYSTSADSLHFTTETLTNLTGTAKCSPCGDQSLYPLPHGRLMRIYYDNFDPKTGVTMLLSAIN